MLHIGQRRLLGVTIGPTVVEAAEAGSWMPLLSRPLESLASGEARWPSLTEALRELRTSRRSSGGRLAVALLPPFVELRPVMLPPLAAAEAKQVIARNAARYFLGAREPQVIGLAPSPRSAAGGPREILAAAAPVRVIEAIHAAARDAGWELHAIVPAETAWRAAALAIWPDLRHGTHDIAVVRAGRTELLHLQDGLLTGTRRFGEVSAGPSALRDALALDAGGPSASASPVGGLAVLGPAALRETLARTLRGAGARIMAPSAKWTALADTPELAAAAFAGAGAALELVAESAGQLRRARRAKITAAVAAAAVALLAVAGGLELWGPQRELDRVRHERAALRQKVAALIAIRDSAAFTSRRLSELAAASQAAVPWSDVLVKVTRALPRDAYLTAFRGESDSLVLEGLTKHVAGVFAAIDGVPGLSSVRSAAPVRRDLGNREATEVPERFSVAARVAPIQGTFGLALGAPGGRP